MAARDKLCHLLFNAVKRPDADQRRVIIDAFASLAVNFGRDRTVEELLPQCWEQLTHSYPERRVLVAEACGQLAQAVGDELAGSLLLSMLEQLLADKAPLVRLAVCENLVRLTRAMATGDKLNKIMQMYGVVTL